MTWIELDVSSVFGIPLVLAGATRSRRLLWLLAILFIITTFAVYSVQIAPGAFRLQETFFVNRLLDVVSLLLIAVLLHLWMSSADKSESQTRVIEEQNKKLEAAKVSRRIIEVQEAERRSLASQLHDLVGQKLTALSINLNIVKTQLGSSVPAPINARLDDSETLVGETIESIRDVMAELRPAVLDDYGLTPVLRWYAEQFVKRTGIATTVTEKGPIRRLSPETEEALFRIVQEALANVAKYAHAGNATVTVGAMPQGTCLTIADDGCGFDPAGVAPPGKDHGWGLMIMRERAASLGAELTIKSLPGHGTQVVVTMPSEAPS